MKIFNLSNLLASMLIISGVAPTAYASSVIGNDHDDVKIIVNNDNGMQGDFIVQNRVDATQTETLRSSLTYTKIKTNDGNSLLLNNDGVVLSDNDGNGLTLNGVKNAELSANSKEAVNGSQLHNTNQKVDANITTTNQNTTDIATNTTNIGKNTTDIATNATNIGKNTTDIATNTTNIGKNTTDIATNATNIGKNTTDIATNTTKIGKNTTDIATNATNIGKNTADIKTNTTNISTNTVNIGRNTADILNLRSDINDIYGKLSDQKSEYRSGIASIAAMANIPVVPGKTFSAGLGVGNFKNETAVAAGANWNITPSVSTKLSIGFESSNVTVGTGVAFGF